MTDTLKPRDAKDVENAVQWALAESKALEVVGRGSKRALGRPGQTDVTLDLSGLSGVTLYEPEELVLSARAGTSMTEIEALVASKNQQLEFEPMDYGPLLGQPDGAGSLGGAIAANLAGPRRIKSGAARDHFLGVSAVSGRGETFKSGGRVVKNVTGYDLCKLLAGSFGTLAVMTEVTLKVTPRPEAERTLLIAVALVILLVFLFLGKLRTAMIPALAVPVSLVGTFAVMYLAGFSLNTLSLMALILAAGLVVDDAIVVLENIARHIDDGVPPLRAAYIGTREVGFTLLSMNVSLVVVFVSILFMGGIQLISVGILGEYIGRIYEEVRGRPRFIVDRAVGFPPRE